MGRRPVKFPKTETGHQRKTHEHAHQPHDDQERRASAPLGFANRIQQRRADRRNLQAKAEPCKQQFRVGDGQRRAEEVRGE